jgi:hypothetical protein
LGREGYTFENKEYIDDELLAYYATGGTAVKLVMRLGETEEFGW